MVGGGHKKSALKLTKNPNKLYKITKYGKKLTDTLMVMYRSFLNVWILLFYKGDFNFFEILRPPMSEM